MGITQTTGKRKTNIELLRIVAMIMIIAHHIAIHSGFVFPSETITLNSMWIQLIQLGGKVGVNIFVLITGYFSVTIKSVKYSKAIKLWMQIFTYSIAAFLLSVLLSGGGFGFKSLLENCFPITYSTWWFASAYFVLYILSPFINRFVTTIDKKTYLKLLGLLMFFWCIIPTFLAESWQANSFLWLVFLYVFSGYIRLYIPITKIKSRNCLLFALIVVVLTYVLTIALNILGLRYSGVLNYVSYFYDMRRIPMFLIAVSLFLGFLNLNVSYKPFINVISSATFGVYLIHDNTVVRDFLWTTLFKNHLYAQSKFLAAYTVLQVVVVFVVCTVIELIRIYCVEKLYVGLIDKLIVFGKNRLEKVQTLNFFIKLKGYFKNSILHDFFS